MPDVTCAAVTAAAALSVSALQGNTCFNCRLCAWLPATASRVFWACARVRPRNTQEKHTADNICANSHSSAHMHMMLHAESRFQTELLAHAQMHWRCIRSCSCLLCVRLCALCVTHTCRVSLETPLCKNTQPHTCKTTSRRAHTHTRTYIRLHTVRQHTGVSCQLLSLVPRK